MRTDSKNFKLIESLAQLRDHIDIHRLIGLNLAALRDSKIDGALLGYMQKSALESLAIYICKIYESSGRNELDSIPAILESLAIAQLSVKQKQAFFTFGHKYGNHCDLLEAKSYLKGTFGLFCGIHSESLNRLKEFRDKVGAHTDSKAAIKELPSHSEFEALFSFAYDFRQLVSRFIIDFAPASVPRRVGPAFVELLGSIGVKAVKFHFDD